MEGRINRVVDGLNISVKERGVRMILGFCFWSNWRKSFYFLKWRNVRGGGSLGEEVRIRVEFGIRKVEMIIVFLKGGVGSVVECMSL